MKKIFLIISFLLFPLFSQKVFAQADNSQDYFDISLDASYVVQENGITKVSQEFTIINKSPQYLIEEYAVIVGSNKIDNVVVTQQSKKLDTNVVNTTNQTSISIKFPDKNVGQGKKRVFTLNYNSPDIAIVSGNALEVSIPRLAKKNLFDNYQVSIETPLKYGGPSKSTPANSDWIAKNTHVLTKFDNLTDESILVFYGREQYYDLSLRYNLENTTEATGIIQIALPPDTLYQKMNYVDLNPTPLKIEKDSDGNWIASYQLQAQEKLIVHLTLQTLVSLDAIGDYPNVVPNSNYTREQKYWPNNKNIINLAQKQNSARDIYKYVVDTLSYNYQKIGNKNIRLGAQGTIQNPENSSCQEFTDLFVSLARAKNIPSRRLTGYAFTQNNVLRPLSLVQDVLHTWPEYYDYEKDTWIQVDPTWENTTGGINYFDQFDLNHIVFAINGDSSETPYPAGSYKFEEQNSKDVKVQFADNFSTANFDVKLSLDQYYFYQIPWIGRYSLKIQNLTGQAWYQIPLGVNSDDSNLQIHSNIEKIDALLPFQQITVPISAQSKNWSLPTEKALTIRLNNTYYHYDIKAGSQLSNYFSNPVALTLLGSSIIVITLTAGSLLVLRRKR
ncbi:MAG: transglutaminase family protein [Patescibacteria group bacterium]